MGVLEISSKHYYLGSESKVIYLGWMYIIDGGHSHHHETVQVLCDIEIDLRKSLNSGCPLDDYAYFDLSLLILIVNDRHLARDFDKLC
jgi:hypothetical protein